MHEYSKPANRDLAKNLQALSKRPWSNLSQIKNAKEGLPRRSLGITGHNMKAGFVYGNLSLILSCNTYNQIWVRRSWFPTGFWAGRRTRDGDEGGWCRLRRVSLYGHFVQDKGKGARRKIMQRNTKTKEAVINVEERQRRHMDLRF